MVHYNGNITPGTVELTLQTAGEHHLLLEGLVNIIRMAVQCPDNYPQDPYKIVVVADFLSAILPDEYQLEYGIERAKKSAKARKNIQSAGQ